MTKRLRLQHLPFQSHLNWKIIQMAVKRVVKFHVAKAAILGVTK
jgi:hypothetical protein